MILTNVYVNLHWVSTEQEDRETGVHSLKSFCAKPPMSCCVQ